MNKEELIKARDLVMEQHDNLSNSNWITAELHHLRGKYDILCEVIATIEKEEQHATDSTKNGPNSDNDQGEQAV
jgi:hypothetical protein